MNGKWLWLSNGKPGWLDSRHVIPLNRAAVDRLTKMLDADPRKAGFHACRAIVWDSLGDYKNAISDLDEAIRLDPSNAAKFTILGRVQLSKADYDKALADLPGGKWRRTQ